MAAIIFIVLAILMFALNPDILMTIGVLIIAFVGWVIISTILNKKAEKDIMAEVDEIVAKAHQEDSGLKRVRYASMNLAGNQADITYLQKISHNALKEQVIYELKTALKDYELRFSELEKVYTVSALTATSFEGSITANAQRRLHEEETAPVKKEMELLKSEIAWIKEMLNKYHIR